MANTPMLMNQEVFNYISKVSGRESQHLQDLRVVSERQPNDVMRSSPEHAQFLCLLLKMIRAKLVVEVGVYTGYTTLAFAETLSEINPHKKNLDSKNQDSSNVSSPETNAKVIACDVVPEFPEMAKPFWRQAGVEDYIDLRIAPAENTLTELIADKKYCGKIDFIFIDADKPAYPGYFDQALDLLRPGGVIALDNTLLKGRVLDQENQEQAVVVMRDLNARLQGDSRVDLCLLPIADGLTLAVKR